VVRGGAVDRVPYGNIGHVHFPSFKQQKHFRHLFRMLESQLFKNHSFQQFHYLPDIIALPKNLLPVHLVSRSALAISTLLAKVLAQEGQD
jgi:hypothetical protein